MNSKEEKEELDEDEWEDELRASEDENSSRSQRDRDVGSNKRRADHREVGSGDQDTKRRAVPETLAAADDRRHPQGLGVEVVLRMLVPVAKMGVVIGRSGAHIRALREETGARIKISDSAPRLKERLVVLTSGAASSEHKDAQSPAEVALFRLCDYVNEAPPPDDEAEAGAEAEGETESNQGPNLDAGGDSEDPMDDEEPEVAKRDRPGEPGGAGGEPSSSSKATVRLVVAANQAGSVIGKGGSIIKMLREASGASVQMNDDAPSGTLPGDRVLQISGEKEPLKQALESVCAILRANPPRPPREDTANAYPSRPTYARRGATSVSSGGILSDGAGGGSGGGGGSHHHHHNAGATYQQAHARARAHAHAQQAQQARHLDLYGAGAGIVGSGPISRGGHSHDGLLYAVDASLLDIRGASPRLSGRLQYPREVREIREVHTTERNAKERVVEVSGTGNQVASAQSLIEAFTVGHLSSYAP
eukprot:jgi/Mesen1/3553/ME000199S02710